MEDCASCFWPLLANWRRGGNDGGFQKWASEEMSGLFFATGMETEHQMAKGRDERGFCPFIMNQTLALSLLSDATALAVIQGVGV